jgi:hypothetical protein
MFPTKLTPNPPKKTAKKWPFGGEKRQIFKSLPSVERIYYSSFQAEKGV